MDEPPPSERRFRDSAAGNSRERILEATAVVLGRRGTTKLSLSEVALQAGVARMTLYRFFPSKDDLISAFTRYESDQLEVGLARATVGLRGVDKLDATLRFVVDYQLSYSGVRMLDIEPGQVLERIGVIMPVLRERLASIIPGPDAEVAAATVMRVAVSHYVVRGDDAEQFLAQLRHAVGIKPGVARRNQSVKRKSTAKSNTGRARRNGEAGTPRR
jgi:AcrR family transcriptional regulator